MTYTYQIYVVDDATYEAHRIGEQYQGGRVVDGIGGLNNEQLLVVAYEETVLGSITRYQQVGV